MAKYVYDEQDISDIIEEILDGFDDDYCIDINGVIYARMFHSNMTGIDVAILSDNRADVENISDGDFVEWLDNVQDGVSDGETFYGLAVVDDESESLIHYRSAVIFPAPIPEIIEQYGATTEREILSYGKVVDDFWCTPYIPWQGGISNKLVKVVDYSYFRF